MFLYHFLIAPTEHRIQIDFVEQFDIRPSSSCNLAGVELKDGGTDFSPSIGNKIVIFCIENFHEKNCSLVLLYFFMLGTCIIFKKIIILDICFQAYFVTAEHQHKKVLEML